MSTLDDLHELCAATNKAVEAMKNYSGAASQVEGHENWAMAKDMWRRFDATANGLTSFAAVVAGRNPHAQGQQNEGAES